MLRRWVSVLDWLPNCKRADLRSDVVAGVTGAPVNYLDSTADHELRKLVARYRERGITLLLVNVEEPVRADASGFTELIGTENFFATDADAVAHLETRP